MPVMVITNEVGYGAVIHSTDMKLIGKWIDEWMKRFTKGAILRVKGPLWSDLEGPESPPDWPADGRFLGRAITLPAGTRSVRALQFVEQERRKILTDIAREDHRDA